jgi:hypothetical protein
MKYKITWHFLFEFLSICVSLSLAFLLLFYIKPLLSKNFFQIIFVFLFFAIFYIQKIIFIDKGIINFFWVKVFFFLANLPLFFFLIRTFQYNMQIFDGFAYKIEPNGISEIWPDIKLNTLFYIKNLYIFGGSIAIISLVLLQLKIIIQIFKNQQVPVGLFGGNRVR